MKNNRLGFAVTGSFCTLKKTLDIMRKVKAEGYDIFPIVSEIVYSTDTRFGESSYFINEIENICDRKVIKSVKESEPIGPKGLLDILVVLPCTGNTLAKTANGITDSSVTMAIKAHLRNDRPVLIGVSTNDGLGNSAKNIGKLMNMKNIFLIPFRQDDYENKPNSLVADFDLTIPALECAIEKKQIQPLLIM